ncbi:hypothetical protein Micbo1qcDRAFT_161748, partial [Microdochium bolleyi]
MLQRLARSHYWTRLFVIPELILAGNIVLCIDNTTIEWNTFERLVGAEWKRKQDNVVFKPFDQMARILDIKRFWDEN